MKQIEILLGLGYLIMFARLFERGVKFIKRDSGVSSQAKPFHILCLLAITILWPVVVPISYLELLSKQENSIDANLPDA